MSTLWQNIKKIQSLEKQYKEIGEWINSLEKENRVIEECVNNTISALSLSINGCYETYSNHMKITKFTVEADSIIVHTLVVSKLSPYVRNETTYLPKTTDIYSEFRKFYCDYWSVDSAIFDEILKKQKEELKKKKSGVKIW